MSASDDLSKLSDRAAQAEKNVGSPGMIVGESWPTKLGLVSRTQRIGRPGPWRVACDRPAARMVAFPGDSSSGCGSAGHPWTGGRRPRAGSLQPRKQGTNDPLEPDGDLQDPFSLSKTPAQRHNPAPKSPTIIHGAADYRRY